MNFLATLFLCLALVAPHARTHLSPLPPCRLPLMTQKHGAWWAAPKVYNWRPICSKSRGRKICKENACQINTSYFLPVLAANFRTDFTTFKTFYIHLQKMLFKPLKIAANLFILPLNFFSRFVKTCVGQGSAPLLTRAIIIIWMAERERVERRLWSRAYL
jgi:hypothetical protein